MSCGVLGYALADSRLRETTVPASVGTSSVNPKPTARNPQPIARDPTPISGERFLNSPLTGPGSVGTLRLGVRRMYSRSQQWGGNTSAREAFSLVEILVVMALIGVLAGLVLGVSRFAQGKSLRSNTTAEMERIKSALEEYRLDYGQFPDVTSFTQMIQTNSGDAFEDLLDFIDPHFVDFVDAWGRPFEYERVSKFQYRLRSLGPDESIDEDDLANWKGNQ